ncbi:helix-turn-helix domain-containing protein [Bradyrhizobium sp. 139]|uniref:helix-turn-helix domain-containing protein n=1 Tax=Bradyrhizobium sp. 139 TaxID=2782616 RepID=UPI001FFB6DF1|nr:helix-turn-helix domain-containing protein [Bradyrhizobium sp. 139]MCK1740310.1 helix-turn-helix domain-containing protein [Bradyrhizobium sp. 139]
MGQSSPMQVQVRSLESFEELNDAVRGTNREVVQLGRGRLRGHLAHFAIDELSFDVGEFSVGMRSRGVPSDHRVSIGMLTGCTDKVTQWSREMHAGDVMVTPPGGEHDARYFGGASFAVISLSFADICSFFASEPRAQDANSWRQNIFRAAPQSTSLLLSRLNGLLARLRDQNIALTREAAQFWRRSIIEAMTATVLPNVPSDDDRSLSSASKIVRRVEEYLDRAGMVPIHISQICGDLNVSRRTLHRAFHDVLGIGPVAFLHHRRLCSIHSVLRCSDPTTTTIADVALQHGYLNPGRFSDYYRSLFDEYPSQSFGRRFVRSVSIERKHRPAFTHRR